MIFVLIGLALFWAAALVLVLGLCMAAANGDRMLEDWEDDEYY